MSVCKCALRTYLHSAFLTLVAHADHLCAPLLINTFLTLALTLVCRSRGNIDILLQKRMDSLQEAFINPRAVRHVLLWMDALYWTYFGLLKNNTHSLPL